eukprot:gene4209-4904_t
MTVTTTDTPPKTEVIGGSGNARTRRDMAVCDVCTMRFPTAAMKNHRTTCMGPEEMELKEKERKEKRLPQSPPSAGQTPKKRGRKPKAKPILVALEAAAAKIESNKNSSNILSNGNNKEKSGKMMSGVVMDAKRPRGRPPKKARGQADMSARTWAKDTVAKWEVPEAPVFYPTVEEFRYPLKYIEAIRPVAEKFGICKIVPPYQADSIGMQIDAPSFRFKTKLQNIHQLKTRWSGPSEVFVSELCGFLEERNETLSAFPQYDARDLDLYTLFVEVNRRGGLWDVTRSNAWQEILVALKVSDTCQKPIQSLKALYNKHLYAYELERKKQFDEEVAAGHNRHATMVDQVIAECINAGDYEEDNSDEEDFGFYEGNTYSLDQFERLATNFAKKWFPNGNNDPDSVENEFWRIVEHGDENVQVHYGSDLDVRIHGSGFPRGQGDNAADRAACRDGTHWNLNTLPRMEGSIFSHLRSPISGVTDPMMYVGMLFSSFCWHNEDNYLYSINYMHRGSYKTWYGVPGDSSPAFEAVMREAVPSLFSKTPNLLYLLITMVAPSLLRQKDVPIFKTLQAPGEYVITFPQAYHAGFSHGFTVAEAVNFAPGDWLPYGAKSVSHYKDVHRTSVLPHDHLMMAIARDATPELCQWLAPGLATMRATEVADRSKLIKSGYRVEENKHDDYDDDDVKQCAEINKSIDEIDAIIQQVNTKLSEHQKTTSSPSKPSPVKITRSAATQAKTPPVSPAKQVGANTPVYKFPFPSSNQTSPTPSMSLIYSPIGGKRKIIPVPVNLSPNTTSSPLVKQQ